MSNGPLPNGPKAHKLLNEFRAVFAADEFIRKVQFNFNREDWRRDMKGSNQQNCGKRNGDQASYANYAK